MSHKLFIDVQDSVNDNKYIYVTDLSVYDEVLGAKRRMLQVLPPFSDEYVLLDFPTNQVTAFNTDALKLTCNGNIEDMPDGPYKFNFSVSPNKEVNIEVCHYRVARLMNLVLSKMIGIATECDSSIDQCGNISVNKYQNMLLHVWMLLKGVQQLGRHNLMIDKAKDLYNQAQSSYDRLYNLENCKMC